MNKDIREPAMSDDEHLKEDIQFQGNQEALSKFRTVAVANSKRSHTLLKNYSLNLSLSRQEEEDIPKVFEEEQDI